jgi:hypothetical protein
VADVGLAFDVPDDVKDSDEGGRGEGSLDGEFDIPGSLVGCEARYRRIGRGRIRIGRDRLDVQRYLVD